MSNTKIASNMYMYIDKFLSNFKFLFSATLPFISFTLFVYFLRKS